MFRFFYSILLGLIGSGLVFLAIILLTPRYSQNTAWLKMVEIVPEGSQRPVTLSQNGQSLFSAQSQDPFFRSQACRYDLNNGALLLTGPQTDLIWTLSVVDTNGTVLFSTNNRLSTASGVQVLVVNKKQIRTFRQTSVNTFASAFIAQSTGDEGLVVIRIFEENESAIPLIDEFTQGLTCSYERF